MWVRFQLVKGKKGPSSIKVILVRLGYGADPVVTCDQAQLWRCRASKHVEEDFHPTLRKRCARGSRGNLTLDHCCNAREDFVDFCIDMVNLLWI